MGISSSLNESVIESLVKAFSGSTDGIVNEIKIEYGMGTGNFKNGGAWDLRFDRIKQVALQNDLVVLTRRRGIWTFICVLNIETGILYVFSKDKNIDTVIKNLGKKNIHYFHAFVSLNSGPIDLDNQQLSLFSTLPEDYETKRLSQVQRILGEEYPLVKQVVFVVAKEEDKKIVGVEGRLFNRYFELLSVENWSSYVPKDDYSDILVLNEETIDNTDNNVIIPQVKQEIKDRKEHFERKIPTRKKDKKKLKEEDMN